MNGVHFISFDLWRVSSAVWGWALSQRKMISYGLAMSFAMISKSNLTQTVTLICHIDSVMLG